MTNAPRRLAQIAHSQAEKDAEDLEKIAEKQARSMPPLTFDAPTEPEPMAAAEPLTVDVSFETESYELATTLSADVDLGSVYEDSAFTEDDEQLDDEPIDF